MTTRAGRGPYDVVLMFCPASAELRRGWAKAVAWSGLKLVRRLADR